MAKLTLSNGEYNPIKIREKKLSGGMLSIYLDIHFKGERQKEYLGLKKFETPKTHLEKSHNKEIDRKVSEIKNKRYSELLSNEFGLKDSKRFEVDFIGYFETYITTYSKTDIKVIRACFNEFKSMLNEKYKIKSLECKNLNEKIIVSYKESLELKFKGETPNTYFKRFKKVARQGIKDGFFPINPFDRMDTLKFNIDNNSVKKDILTFEEIQSLSNTDCTNTEIKNAFLFCLNTGLRFCDVTELVWSNVGINEITFKQSKTSKEVTIKLNQNALHFIGERKNPNDKVFTLPSHNGCIKSLRYWVKKAQITKKITWHCARHSFATNLLISKNNVKTVSDLLGHSTLKHTEKYVRKVKAMENEAVNSLPNINF